MTGYVHTSVTRFVYIFGEWLYVYFQRLVVIMGEIPMRKGRRGKTDVNTAVHV